MAVGQEAGRALVGPFHRAAQRLRRMQDADIFGIVDVLHAERAADIGGQQVDLLVRHLQQVLGEVGAVAGDALGRNLNRVALARLVVGGERRARLHRHHGDAGIDDVELGHMRGARRRRPRPWRRRHSDSPAPHCWGCDRRAAARRAWPLPRRSVTAGSGSISSTTASAASRACASVSATTNATGSPTKRTLSVTSAARLVCSSGEPSRFFSGRPQVKGP